MQCNDAYLVDIFAKISGNGLNDKRIAYAVETVFAQLVVASFVRVYCVGVDVLWN